MIIKDKLITDIYDTIVNFCTKIDFVKKINSVIDSLKNNILIYFFIYDIWYMIYYIWSIKSKLYFSQHIIIIFF